MTGTFNCPLCGRDTPHEHSPAEQVIYRNGCKVSQGQLREAQLKVLREAAWNVTIWIKELDADDRYYVKEQLQRMADELKEKT